MIRLKAWGCGGLAVLPLCCVMLSAAWAQDRTDSEDDNTFLLRAAKILTVTQGALNHGALLVEDGKLAALGTDIQAPEGVRVLDFPDAWVFPGFVDIHSHLGGTAWDINDMVNPTNPELRVLQALDPENQHLKQAAAGGVTTILTIPGSGTNVSGFGVLIKTAGRTAEEMLVRFPGVMKVAQGYNPERHAGDLGRTRMGMSWLLRRLLDRAKQYTKALDAYERGERAEPPEPQPDLEWMVCLFRRECPALVHTAGARDTMATMRMFHDDYGLWVIPSHVTFDGYRVGEEAAKRNLPMNLGPRMVDLSFSREGRFVCLAAAYERAGVENLSINTDAPVLPQEDLFLQAAISVRNGLSDEMALKAITINPARAIGIDHLCGSLEVGKDADLVVKDGPPLDVSTPIRKVFIRGREVFDLESQQPGEASSWAPED